MEQKKIKVKGRDGSIKKYLAFPDEPFFAVENEKEKVGFINSDGKLVVPCKYDDADEFESVNLNGKVTYVVAVKKNGKWGYLDEKGKEILPCKYDDVGGFYDGWIKVKLNGVRGYVDIESKSFVTTRRYCDFKFPCTVENEEKKVGYINSDGKLAIPCVYDDMWIAEYADVIAVEKNGKWGYVDDAGNEVVPCKYYDYADAKKMLDKIIGNQTETEESENE